VRSRMPRKPNRVEWQSRARRASQVLTRCVNSHTNGPYRATNTALKTNPITIQVHASACWVRLSILSTAPPRSVVSALADHLGSTFRLRRALQQ
jgi:hypothetical protein